MDQKSGNDNDSIGNDDEQLSTEKEIHKKLSNSEQVETTTNIEHTTDKIRRVGEVAKIENDYEETENVDDTDGLLKVFKAIIPFSSKKYRHIDEENETYGFEDDRRSSKKSSKKYSNIVLDDRNKLLNNNEDQEWKHKSSFRESITMPKKMVENSDPKSNLSHRGSEGRNQGISPFHLPHKEQQGYPFQSNIQKHPHVTYKPRDNKTQTVIDPDSYNFNHLERGHMVLIVNEFQGQSFRDGSLRDLSNMREIAEKFGFRLFNNDNDINLSQPQTMRLLREAQRADHSNCDCFLFMISTHGLEQRNIRAKFKLDHALVCADDQLIFTSSILEMFNDDNCPALKNKPKFFFIQACRGDDLDHGSYVSVVKNIPVNKPFGVTEVFSSDESSSLSTQRKKWRESNFDEYDVKFKYDASETNIETNRVSFPQSLPRHEEQLPQPNKSHTVNHAQGTVSAKGGEIPLQNPLEPRLNPSFCSTQKVTLPHHPYSRFTHSSSEFSPSKQVNKIYAPTPYAIVDTPSLRCDNDMLVMYAIPQGMYAWRSNTDGSWMIYYLHKFLWHMT